MRSSMRKEIKRFDERVTKGVGSLFGVRSRSFFLFNTMLGEPVLVSGIALGIGVVGLHTKSEWMLAVALAIPATLAIGVVLKILFERTRPLTDYAMNMRFHTYSFPSGHSSGSIVAYGSLAYVALTMLVKPYGVLLGAIFCIVPLFVGISRVYLGAHFPSDVIAGWTLGLIVLASVLVMYGGVLI